MDIDTTLVTEDLTKKVILETFDKVEDFEKLLRVADNATEWIKDSIKSRDGLVKQSDVLTIISAFKKNKHNGQKVTHDGLQWIVENEFKFDNVPFSDEELKFFGINTPA